MYDSLVPAAQYLRMSTDHQQYSLQNQADAIARYATDHDFQIVTTYSDAAKSGLRLKNRTGLKQLLKEVMKRQCDFRAILVYDVSRWGRFQDMDEAAHYEYVCKSAGVPVYYCAETFANDNTALSGVLKALKRTMAGEYSRELSVRVRSALLRLAKLGYKLGGIAPYGLRRQLLDKQGRPKQQLEFGQRKNLIDERVNFVAGPATEVAIVNRVFREFADEGQSVNSIATRLNDEGVPYFRGATWKGDTLRLLLQNPRYVGMHIWGRTTGPLATRPQRLPFKDWVICPNAFEPIIPYELFLRAQQVFANFTIRLTDEQMLSRLRDLYKEHGHLSSRIIDMSPLCPGLSTYYKRFGTLTNAYEQIGYNAPEKRNYASLRQRGSLVRKSLIAGLLDAFPNELQELRKNKRFRPVLRYRQTGLLISIVFARCCKKSAAHTWIVEIPKSERNRTTLLALLDVTGGYIESFRIFPRIPAKHRHMRLREKDQWFRSGLLVPRIEDFLVVLRTARKHHARGAVLNFVS